LSSEGDTSVHESTYTLRGDAVEQSLVERPAVSVDGLTRSLLSKGRNANRLQAAEGDTICNL
jgi:hypothetical protein